MNDLENRIGQGRGDESPPIWFCEAVPSGIW